MRPRALNVLRGFVGASKAPSPGVQHLFLPELTKVVDFARRALLAGARPASRLVACHRRYQRRDSAGPNGGSRSRSFQTCPAKKIQGRLRLTRGRAPLTAGLCPTRTTYLEGLDQSWQIEAGPATADRDPTSALTQAGWSDDPSCVQSRCQSTALGLRQVPRLNLTMIGFGCIDLQMCRLPGVMAVLPKGLGRARMSPIYACRRAPIGNLKRQ